MSNECINHPCYDPVMTLPEAAAYVRRHDQTLRRAVRAGELECFRRGARGYMFFRLAQLNQWLGRLKSSRSRAAVA